MTTMSEMFRNQQNDPKMKDIPFEERFAMLVDAEHASRKSYAFERLVKKAELEQNDAGVATIDYHSGRKLNRSLIIDEWLLFKLRENEARLLLEVIHKRRKKSSTIFCSQYEEKDWYNQICDGESTLADAIMDRISFDSYKINIEYVDKSVDKSMREVYGLNPSETQ